MEDLIARLYPYDKNENAREAVKKPVNLSRHIEALKKPAELPGRHSRESTAPLGDGNEKKKGPPAWHDEEGLQLTFSHGPKAGKGFVIGTRASSCDIVVDRPKDNKISGRHCYIAFDAERRLIVRDGSTHGTIVEYDDKGGERRRNFTWIIGGHEFPNKIENIVIEIHHDLKFQIVVSKPTFPDLFFDNVDQFRAEVAENDELPFGALGLQSATSTAAASGIQTPREQFERADTPNENSILLKRKKLGQGTFSNVYHVWDVSTGFEYASKKFRNPEKVDWKREASLMKQTSHEHITRLIATIEKPSPRLILEYLPLGNLEDQDRQRSISCEESLTILHQSLLALTYLHEQTPPIAHRDIKPANILVQSRDPLHIKLADFGLSKASDYLKTVCGTHNYLAPELAQYYTSKSPRGFKYTCAADIWSLGVVIFEFAYDLPDPDKLIGLPWCEEIANELGDWESDGLIDILSTMIVVDHKLREPARECLRRASRLLAPGRSLTPTPAACGVQRGQTEDDDGSTIILGNMWGAQGDSSHGNSDVYSTYPVGIKRQRSPAVGSTNTSSSRRRTKRRQPETRHTNDVSDRYGASDRLGELYNAILKLFVDLKVDASQDLDDRTCTLAEELCENFRRLDITGVRLSQNDVSGQATVSAVRESEEFVLVTLTPSELICHPGELAARLLNMLQLHSSQRRSRAMAPMEKATIHTSFGAQELKNPSSWTADSLGSQITDSNVQRLGVTYPSVLLDVCNISGCTEPH